MMTMAAPPPPHRLLEEEEEERDIIMKSTTTTSTTTCCCRPLADLVHGLLQQLNNNNMQTNDQDDDDDCEPSSPSSLAATTNLQDIQRVEKCLAFGNPHEKEYHGPLTESQTLRHLQECVDVIMTGEMKRQQQPQDNRRYHIVDHYDGVEHNEDGVWLSLLKWQHERQQQLRAADSNSGGGNNNNTSNSRRWVEFAVTTLRSIDMAAYTEIFPANDDNDGYHVHDGGSSSCGGGGGPITRGTALVTSHHDVRGLFSDQPGRIIAVDGYDDDRVSNNNNDNNTMILRVLRCVPRRALAEGIEYVVQQQTADNVFDLWIRHHEQEEDHQHGSTLPDRGGRFRHELDAIDQVSLLEMLTDIDVPSPPDRQATAVVVEKTQRKPLVALKPVVMRQDEDQKQQQQPSPLSLVVLKPVASRDQDKENDDDVPAVNRTDQQQQADDEDDGVEPRILLPSRLNKQDPFGLLSRQEKKNKEQLWSPPTSSTLTTAAGDHTEQSTGRRILSPLNTALDAPDLGAEPNTPNCGIRRVVVTPEGGADRRPVSLLLPYDEEEDEENASVESNTNNTIMIDRPATTANVVTPRVMVDVGDGKEVENHNTHLAASPTTTTSIVTPTSGEDTSLAIVLEVENLKPLCQNEDFVQEQPVVAHCSVCRRSRSLDECSTLEPDLCLDCGGDYDEKYGGEEEQCICRQLSFLSLLPWTKKKSHKEHRPVVWSKAQSSVFA